MEPERNPQPSRPPGPLPPPPPTQDMPPPNQNPPEKEPRAIFVGNFEYESKSSDLERLFSSFGRVARIDIKRGFAFVFMQSEEHGQAAINALDGHVFGDTRRRTLKVEWARGDGAIKRREDERRRRQMDPSETLFVVNFDPNSTTRHSLDLLFSPYGPIVRLDLQQRFAFIQYEHIQHATAAMRGLNGTQIADRHIIVEYTVRGGTQPNRKRLRDRPYPYETQRPIHPLRNPYGRSRSPSPRPIHPRARMDRPSWGAYSRERSRSPRTRPRDRPSHRRDADDRGQDYRGRGRDRHISERDLDRPADHDRPREGDTNRYRSSRSPSPRRGRRDRTGSRSRSRSPKRRGRSPERASNRSGDSKGVQRSPERRRSSRSRSLSRGRSADRSPVGRSADRSPVAKRRREISRSPDRSRLRSPSPLRKESSDDRRADDGKTRMRDSRSPSPHGHRSRSVSREGTPDRSREQSRSRSPARSRHHGRSPSRSRSPRRERTSDEDFTGKAYVMAAEDPAAARSSDDENRRKETESRKDHREAYSGSPRRTPSTFADDRPMAV